MPKKKRDTNVIGSGRAGPGRPKGGHNLVTVEMKAYAHKFLTSRRYLRNLEKRILAGAANHMETFLSAHVYGKPRDVVEVHDARPLRDMADDQLDSEIAALWRQVKAEEAERVH